MCGDRTASAGTEVTIKLKPFLGPLPEHQALLLRAHGSSGACAHDLLCDVVPTKGDGLIALLLQLAGSWMPGSYFLCAMSILPDALAARSIDCDEGSPRCPLPTLKDDIITLAEAIVRE